MISRRQFMSAATTGSILLVAGCTGSPTPPGPSADGAEEAPRVDRNRHEVLTRAPENDLVVPPGPEGALEASRAVLSAATAVVVLAADGTPTPPADGPDATATPGASADATATATPSTAAPTPPAPTASGSPTGAPSPGAEPTAAPDPAARAETAAATARALGLPLLPDSPDLAAELDRLQTRTVIAYGTPEHVGDREVVPGPATASELTIEGLPVQAEAPAVLTLAAGDLDPATAATLASAGLEATGLIGPHPGGTADSTARVKEHTGPVVAVGEGFGTSEQFAAQVEVTRTASELPGGGIAPFPGRHMIALYGHPQTAALGMMGEQPPAEAVERLKRLVAEYAELVTDTPVVGSFEIITTVASSSATDDGDYSYETPIDLLMPWIEAAEANDIYVVLDLQPGRTHFLEQAKRYEELLKRPWVGLALDPEWRLGENERHLRQIGQVQVDEVNEVGAWLADLVATHKLPPKVLTLHQFQTRMIVDRERLDTSRPEVQYLVHVDGQGPQGSKQGTWGVIKRDLPAHTWLGWKNFEDEDTPMLTPRQTVEQVEPFPQFISYQ